MGLVRPLVDFEIGLDGMADQIIEDSGERTAEITAEIAEEMVTEVVSIVESELPSTENSKPYQTSLANSFMSKTERGSGPGGYPHRGILTIKPGVSKGKVGALNYGVSRFTPHLITPRHAPRALELRGLVRNPPSPKYGSRVFAKSVMHPGGGPTHGVLFLERARETVLARHGITE